MNLIPGPRTKPTVKTLASTNQRNLKRWQISLGPVSVVALIGVVTGCMACSFYLGFLSGQKIGIETALANNLSTAMRLPIMLDEEGSSVDAEVSQVYAKLDSDRSMELHAGGSAATTVKAKPVPDLESIKTIEVAPLSESLGEPETLADIGAVKEALEAERKGEHTVAVTAAEPAQAKTLGALKKEAERSEKVTAVTPADKPADVISAVSKAASIPNKSPATTEKIDQGEPRISSKVNSGWYAQIAAPNKRSDAEHLSSQLHKAGFAVTIEDAQVRGQQYFRVLVGPEGSRIEADRLIVQLKREPFIKGDPFLRVVK